MSQFDVDAREVQRGRLHDGKVALITGSSRGIGRTLALSLAAQGASLVLNYKTNQDLADKVVDEVGQLGGHAIAVRADVEQPEDVDQLFAAARDEYGHLDFFVSNAAASAFKQVNDLKVHHLDRTFAMNVRAFVLGAQRACELMSGRGGRIVALSSYGSVRAYPTYAALGSAKAAIEAWVRYMALEYAPQGINVNAVSGGLIDSDSLDFFYNVPGMPDISTVLAKIPKGRPGSVREVAEAIDFLLGPNSDYITGQTLVVDGGLSIAAPPYLHDATPPLVADTGGEQAGEGSDRRDP